LISFWESIGVDSPSQVLSDLGLDVRSSMMIDLKELSDLLNDELNQSKEIIRFAFEL